jgi:predicted adenylyl cyclase CyaB
MRETELKGVVPDESDAVRRLVRAGAQLVFAGRIEDQRFDTPDRVLLRRDEVLRIRVCRDATGARVQLDFKGPASYDGGYKHREETTLSVGDGAACAQVLMCLGYGVTREIDREVRVYHYEGAQVRFERYPRMDVLLEVEGPPESIEQAIRVMTLPRDSFTTERVSAFVARYEARTGERAAISDREARGEYRDSLADA